MDCAICVAKTKALISFYHEADLHLCVRICKKPVFHDEAHVSIIQTLFSFESLYFEAPHEVI